MTGHGKFQRAARQYCSSNVLEFSSPNENYIYYLLRIEEWFPNDVFFGTSPILDTVWLL